MDTPLRWRRVAGFPFASIVIQGDGSTHLAFSGGSGCRARLPTYPMRFEVWFKPDSTNPERKLAERIFKIEGWQR